MKKPSVSQLLDILSKPALIDWANKQGLLGIDLREKRKRSLAKGSSLHGQIERFVSTGEVMSEKSHQANLERFLSGKNVVSMEEDIETDWFVGRYDAKIEINGKIWMCDYKSGFKGKMYLENKLQLVAYAMAEHSDNLAIIGIPNFVMAPAFIKDRKPYEDILKSLSEIWKLKKGIENE